MSVIILGGFGRPSSSTKENKGTNQSKVEMQKTQLLMKNASSVIIVPGYGMAVAQAQHALREMVDKLKKNDSKLLMQFIQLLEECQDI